MQITPRYDGPPAIDIDAVVDRVDAPLVRQRDRLADAVRHLTPTEWSTPSRCAGWSVQDVIAHIVGVNRFWALSIQAGAAGEPTRILAGFDPVAVPAQMVDAARGVDPAQTLADLVESNAVLAAAVGAVDDWSRVAEAPPGHIATRAVAAHALWDAWIHERDALAPLGRTQPAEADELVACLAYAAAIGPGLRAAAGEHASGTVHIAATDPVVELTVTLGPTVTVAPGLIGPGDATVTGAAVDLIEALSFRTTTVDVSRTARDLLGGLDDAFDRTGS